MSFQQGLSGLNGAAKSLDVIGNNIANASTVGFKGSQAQFADVYANSLNGAGGNQAGIGTKVSQIAQQFTQGNIESVQQSAGHRHQRRRLLPHHGGGRHPVFAQRPVLARQERAIMVNAQGAQLTGYQVGPTGTCWPVRRRRCRSTRPT